MTRRIVSVCGLSVLFILLAACESISTPGGELPKEWLAKVNSLIGVYLGSRGSYGPHAWGNYYETSVESGYQARISLQGSRPILEISPDFGGAGCGSSVGNLLSVRDGEDGTYSANFAFNPGRCASQIWGREISAYFYLENGQVKLRLWLVWSHDAYQRPTGQPGRFTNDAIEKAFVGRLGKLSKQDF